MAGKKAVHFGGGNIGRGFVGLFESEAGYEVVFCDVVDDLIKQMQSTPSYTVSEVSDKGEKTKTVKGYRAVNSRTSEDQAVDEVATADLVTCAVGVNILKFIAPVIAKGIAKRSADKQPLAVIACENAVGNTDILKGHIIEKLPKDLAAGLDKLVRFANCAVDRIVPAQPAGSGLNVRIETFHEWCVEEKPFAGMAKPDISAIHYVSDLQPYIERKLFSVNTAHASAAYLANLQGIKYIHEAMAKPAIKAHVQKVLGETAPLIVAKYGIDAGEQKKYADDIIERISNPELHDDTSRVGRDPLRKLGPRDRLIAPAMQCLERGLSIDALLVSIDAAFRFVNIEGDEPSAKLAKIIAENEPAEVVKQVTQVPESHALFPKLVAIVEKVKA